MANTRETYDSIIVHLPFPPTITAEELLNSKSSKRYRKNGKRRSKVCNSFMVFRAEFYKALKRTHPVLPQSIVSRLASRSWRIQHEEVKKEYVRIARELDRLFLLESEEKSNSPFQTPLIGGESDGLPLETNERNESPFRTPLIALDFLNPTAQPTNYPQFPGEYIQLFEENTNNANIQYTTDPLYMTPHYPSFQP
ncbi:5050_t:CDS:1, partial [Acaulospora colombiana]